MSTGSAIHSTIIKIFSGEADAKEKGLASDWLKKSPENQRLYTELKEIWLSCGAIDNADQYNIEKAVKQFHRKIKKSKQIAARRLIIMNTLKYAAIALLVLSLPLSYFFGKTDGAIKDSFTTVTCALGDKTTMTLPDNSEVWLNSGSKLVFNNNFKKGEREVYLEGEAYFSVAEDKKNPFHVKTSKVEVEVLGTEFNMKAYADEKEITTTLVEGRIKISVGNRETVLKPNQKLIYNSETKKIKLFKLTDTSTETNWKDGRLIFRNESIGELEQKLERWFDVDIVFADETVKKRRFTGTIERESILEVVSYFSLSHYVGYRIDGNEITFYSKNS